MYNEIWAVYVVMQSGRHVSSVSDLYAGDEISVLLEEIHELEPAACRTEDIQDFEIAGSQTGASGGRTTGSLAELDTPGDVKTVCSWDSHANYTHPEHDVSPTPSIVSDVVVYFDDSQLRGTKGYIRISLVCTSVACLLCLCTAGTAKVGLFMLPMVGRIRMMLFVTVFSFLVVSLVLFLDVSHIVHLFPFNMSKMNAFLYVSISTLYLLSSSLIIHLSHYYNENYAWIPDLTIHRLIIAGLLGYLCALEALLLSLFTRCDEEQYHPVGEDPSSINLQERNFSSSPGYSSQHGKQMHHTDSQPCSSKAMDSFRSVNNA